MARLRLDSASLWVLSAIKGRCGNSNLPHRPYPWKEPGKVNFPKTIDFTEWLVAREDVYVPKAKIVIHSVEWDDSGKHEGKPSVAWPDKVEYFVGENGTSDWQTFVGMLLNFLSQADKNKIVSDAKDVWLFNRIGWAEQEALKRPYVERQNRERQTNG